MGDAEQFSFYRRTELIEKKTLHHVRDAASLNETRLAAQR
jgi:hypothetical protein